MSRRESFDGAAWAPVIFFLALIAGFTIASPDVFATSGNLASILNDSAIIAILACGLTVVLLCGEFDLSIGAAASFGGALAVMLVKAGVPLIPAIVAVILAGLILGCANGLLVTYFQTPALIATLAVGSILDGLTQLITGNDVIFEAIPSSFLRVGDWSIGDFAAPVFYLAGIAVLLTIVLNRTRRGRYMHAVGGNRDASRMSGIRVERYVVASFAISGVLAALGGMIYTSRQGSLTPLFGTSFLLPAFAGAFLGSVTLRRGSFHVLGTVIGIYLIGTGTTGLLIVGGPSYSQQLFAGAVLILATSGARFFRRRQRRPPRDDDQPRSQAQAGEPTGLSPPTEPVEPVMGQRRTV